MKNAHAIAMLIDAGGSATDPLDVTACRRAAVWLRWCDGFGATLTEVDATRFAKGGELGEAARSLIRRLYDEFPPAPEDATLRYLEDEEDSSWKHGFHVELQKPLEPVLNPFAKTIECGGILPLDPSP